MCGSMVLPQKNTIVVYIVMLVVTEKSPAPTQSLYQAIVLV